MKLGSSTIAGILTRLLRASVITAIAAALWSCGGGSKGTGGSGFDGTVVTRNSKPAPGVMVTLLETGAFDVTDEQGQFMFDSAIPIGSANLRVETGEFAENVTITDLSPSAQIVTVSIRISVEEQEAEIIDVSVEERTPTPTPKPHKPTRTPAPGEKPTRTPAPGEKPSRTPTAVPTGESPTPAPQPSATVTPTLTSSPAATPSRTPESEEGEDVESEGPIQSLSGDSITVRNRTFLVTNETRIRRGERAVPFGDLAAGQMVHVHGRLQSGIVYAEDIEIAD